MPKNCLEKQRDAFIKQLQWEEKSDNTIAKYRRDIRNFCAYLSCGQTLDKQTVLAYKQHLLQKGYKSSSINSMLVALNRFLVFTGRENCQVKLLKRQRPVFRTHERELSRREYWRLLQYAKSIRYTKAVMLLQTICATGIRVSELAFISVEALHTGEASIVCKGKTRQVAIARKLRQMLLDYCQSRNITHGPVFAGKSGKCMHRTSVWRIMKRLCAGAQVEKQRVFPHNLRHLFAFTYYTQNQSDIMGLAAILGHSSIETTRIYTATNQLAYSRRLDQLGLLLENGA